MLYKKTKGEMKPSVNPVAQTDAAKAASQDALVNATQAEPVAQATTPAITQIATTDTIHY